MSLIVTSAGEADADAIAAVRAAAAAELTRRFGRGQWSAEPTARSVRRDLRGARLLVARDGDAVIATLRLTARRPWSIRAALFTPVDRPIYLVDMAVAPSHQRGGVGRRLVEEAVAAARAWPGDAVRLDAYDHAAGAGGFYQRCGFREVGRATYRTSPLIYLERLLSRADR